MNKTISNLNECDYHEIRAKLYKPEVIKGLKGEYLFTPDTPSTERTLDVLLDIAIDNGMLVTVHDGEAIALRRSNDKAAIVEAMFSVDEERLIFYQGPHDDGEKLGVMLLVHDRANRGLDFVNDTGGEAVDLIWRMIHDIIDDYGAEVLVRKSLDY